METGCCNSLFAAAGSFQFTEFLLIVQILYGSVSRMKRIVILNHEPFCLTHLYFFIESSVIRLI